MIDPHAMDPQTVLRFVRAVSGWPGSVVVIACEPAEVEEPGLGLSPEVAAAVRARSRSRSRRWPACAKRPSARARTDAMHELSLAGAVIDTAERHAGGRRVTLVRLRLGELRQVVPDSLAFYFEHVARGTLCEGAALEHEVVPASLALRACCGAAWQLESASFRCPRVRLGGRRDRGGQRVRGRVDRG